MVIRYSWAQIKITASSTSLTTLTSYTARIARRGRGLVQHVSAPNNAQLTIIVWRASSPIYMPKWKLPANQQWQVTHKKTKILQNIGEMNHLDFKYNVLSILNQAWKILWHVKTSQWFPLNKSQSQVTNFQWLERFLLLLFMYSFAKLYKKKLIFKQN